MTQPSKWCAPGSKWLLLVHNMLTHLQATRTCRWMPTEQTDSCAAAAVGHLGSHFPSAKSIWLHGFIYCHKIDFLHIAPIKTAFWTWGIVRISNINLLSSINHGRQGHFLSLFWAKWWYLPLDISLHINTAFLFGTSWTSNERRQLRCSLCLYQAPFFFHSNLAITHHHTQKRRPSVSREQIQLKLH